MLSYVVLGAALLGRSAAFYPPLSSNTPCFTTTVTPTVPPVTVVVDSSTTRTLAPGPTSSPAQDWLDWRTVKANGVNLGSWLEKERTHDPIWWVEVGGADAPDGKQRIKSTSTYPPPHADNHQNGPSAKPWATDAAQFWKNATAASSTPQPSTSSPQSV
jgi:hypothetical protein